jgi:hypothetical protein
MQDFCVDVIQCLNASAVPAVWALMNFNKSKSGSMSSTTDLMKYITFQALRLMGALKTEFRQVVEHLGGQIYIVVDLATVRASLEDVQGFNFILELSKMLEDASEQGMATKIKVMLVVYEAEWSIILPSEISGSIIPVKAMRQKRRPGNAMRRTITTQVFSNSRGRLGRIRQGR